MMRISIVLFALVMTFTATMIAGQEQTSKAAPEFEELEFWVGNWTSVGTYYDSDFGPGGQFESSESCTWFDANHLAVVCESASDELDSGQRDMTIWSYGYHEGAHTMYHVGGGQSPVLFTGSKDGNTWTFIEATDKVGRYTIEMTSPDTYDFLFEFRSKGNDWAKVAEGHANKAK